MKIIDPDIALQTYKGTSNTCFFHPRLLKRVASLIKESKEKEKQDNIITPRWWGMDYA